jgi:hypothetical protein
MAFLVTVGPGRSAAQTATPAGSVGGHQDLAHAAAQGVAWSGRPMVRLSVQTTGSIRDYALSFSPAKAGGLTTTLDYRIVPKGPIGSFGVQANDHSRDLDPVYLSPAAAMGFERPEVIVGARLSYRFK